MSWCGRRAAQYTVSANSTRHSLFRASNNIDEDDGLVLKAVRTH
jgi:hypothetical protein